MNEKRKRLMANLVAIILFFSLFSLILITTIPIMSAPRTDISYRPTGSSSGYVGEALFFISDISLCDMSREVLGYEWDWGCCQSGMLTDGRTASKVWSNPGTYDVKVRADTGIIRRDKYGKPVSIRDKQTTNWSPALTVTILEVNNPPNAPSKPSGPLSGTVGTSYTFSTSATDSDGDKIKYLFNWGDGTESSWTGLVSSGSRGSSSNTWYSSGTYFVKTQAKDEHGTTSQWSTTMYITISEGDNKEDTNKPPDASFTFSPSNPTTDDIIQFNDKSTDSDGTIISWSWNFGDTTSSTTKNPQHKFSTTGTYTVVLEVADNDRAKKSISKKIIIRQPEPPNVSGLPSIIIVVDASNIEPIEEENEKTIPVTVYCYHQSVSNIHLEILESSNLTITILSPNITLNPNETHELLIKIKAPKLGANETMGSATIKLQAFGDDDMSSNPEQINIKVIKKGATQGFELLLVVCAFALVFLWKRKRI